MAVKKDFTYEIIKTFGVISERGNGWRREVNSISWNDAEPKYDIRDWAPDHEKMGKGISLTEEELMNLMDIVNGEILSVKPDDDLFKDDAF